MIPVPQQHDGQILLMAFLKPFRISAALMGIAPKLLSLQDAPLVKGLVHHIKAHPVTELKQGGIRRVVGHAHGVHPHAFQLLQPPFPDLRRHRRSHASAVVVHAYTVQLFTPSVDQEALFTVKENAADSGWNDHLILLFSIRPYADLYLIQKGVLSGPESGRGYSDSLDKCLLVFGCFFGHGCFTGNSRFPGRARSFGGCRLLSFSRFRLRAQGSGRRINAALHTHSSVRSGTRACHPGFHDQSGLLLRHILTSYEDAIGGDMHGPYADQPHISCDSGAGIPAGIGLGGIVHLHLHNIFLSVRLQKPCHIPFKGRVSVHMAAKLRSVQPYPRKHVRAVKAQDHPSFPHRLRSHAEYLPVPPGSRFRIPAGAAGDRIL